jgi:hypothetical protein
LLDGDHTLAAQIISEMGSNPVTTFVTLLLTEEQKQGGGTQPGSSGLVDDNQCKRP